MPSKSVNSDMTVVSQTCLSLLVDFSAHCYARVMAFVATPED